MNKSEPDIGDGNAGRTCSSKPDGRIKESHGQHFLANSACAGRVFPGCSPQFEINEYPVTWLIVLPAAWTCGQASCTLRAGLCLSVCPSRCASPATPPAETCPQPRGGRSTFLRKTVSAPGGVLRARAAAAGRGLRWRTGHGTTADGRPAPLCSTAGEEAMPDKFFLGFFTQNRTHSTTFVCLKHATKQSAYHLKN